MKKKLFLLAVFISLSVTAQKSSVLSPESEFAVLQNPKDSEYIHRIGRVFGCEELIRLSFIRHVPKISNDSLMAILVNRETRKMCYNYIYLHEIVKRVIAKMELDSIYRDQTNRILIPHNPGIAGENVSYALRIADQCMLSPKQGETIMTGALELARKLYSNPKYNTWDKEMTLLSHTLDKKQINTFFLLKNAVAVDKETNDAWVQLKAVGLTADMDSAKEWRKAYLYLAERHKINDLYRHHVAERRERMSELDSRKPILIRLRDGIEKKRRIEKEKTDDGTAGKAFVW
jgi:hypothetical protein